MSSPDCHRHRCYSLAASVCSLSQCPSTANQPSHHHKTLPIVGCKADACWLLLLTLLPQDLCRDSKLFVCIRSWCMQALCLHSIHKGCLANIPSCAKVFVECLRCTLAAFMLCHLCLSGQLGTMTSGVTRQGSLHECPSAYFAAA